MEIFDFRLIKLGQSKGALVFCEIVFFAVVRATVPGWSQLDHTLAKNFQFIMGERYCVTGVRKWNRVDAAQASIRQFAR